MLGFWFGVRIESLALVNFFIKHSGSFIRKIMKDIRLTVKRNLEDVLKEIEFKEKEQIIPEQIMPNLRRLIHEWQEEVRVYKKK